MRAWLIASAVLLLAFAPAPLPRREKAKDDQARMLGTWQIKTIKWRGSAGYEASAFGDGIVNKQDRVIISRGRISFEAGSGPSSGDRVFTFQLSGTGTVRSIDLTGTNQKRTVLGLYELKGGALHLSIGLSTARPQLLTGDGEEIGFILERR
jgi:hypothetical protein